MSSEDVYRVIVTDTVFLFFLETSVKYIKGLFSKEEGKMKLKSYFFLR